MKRFRPISVSIETLRQWAAGPEKPSSRRVFFASTVGPSVIYAVDTPYGNVAYTARAGSLHEAKTWAAELTLIEALS